jgi:hypothetical protein
MDQILFGDNQFFGINHMSEEKARSQAIRFQDTSAILDVLHDAHRAGIAGFMCTTHDKIEEVCNAVRANPGQWTGFKFYPGMPYAHKYANAITELGYVDAVRKFLPDDGLLSAMMKGGKALLTKDVESVMTLLIDAEMKMFKGLETPVVFLQNIVTDLVQGLGSVDALAIFAAHVRKRYRAEPGFITMNLPKLLPMLKDAGIVNPIVCANVNKAAFRMSGGIDAYRAAARANPARVIAMSVFASGSIKPREAIDWVVQEPYVSSIVFGASSRGNIESSVKLIQDAFARRHQPMARAV